MRPRLQAFPPGFWRQPRHWLALGLGAGALTPAPGTWGTLAAVPFIALCAPLDPLGYGLLLLLAFGLGIWLCASTSRALGVKDHPAIVWDEWVGYGLSLWALPKSWPWLLAAFVLFRFFDILKPWPIGWVDRRLQGGLGIMLDDVLAGVMAWLLLASAYWLL